MGDTASLLQAVSTPPAHRPLAGPTAHPFCPLPFCAVCARIHGVDGRARGRLGVHGRCGHAGVSAHICTYASAHMHTPVSTRAVHRRVAPGRTEPSAHARPAGEPRARSRGEARRHRLGPGPHGPTVYTAGTASTRSIGFKS